MIRRIFMLGAISLAAVSAADKSDKFSVNLYQPVVLNGTTFKTGDAKVELQDGKVILTQGKVSVQVAVKVENGANKYQQTKLAYKDGDHLSEIFVGGTTKHILVQEASAAGQE